ncbi:hypothetical protein HY450_00850 [Candidatus Pacearchaeota archaeon]|nr:hypothetical protein [Candidatus Pacearchaeota archaeon]
MSFFRSIKPDNYLKRFIDYCKKEYGDNLLAIVIYGLYAWGYFDKDIVNQLSFSVLVP